MSQTFESPARDREQARSEVPLAPSVGVITYDPAGHCTSANETAAELVGLSRQALLRQELRSSRLWIDSGLLPHAEAALGGSPCSAVMSLDTAQAGRRHLNVRLESITMAGRPALLAVLSDISELIWLESALRGSRERFRELVDETPDLLFSFDTEGTLIAANKSLAAVTRGDLRELVGKRLGEVGLPPEVATQWESARKKVLGTGLPVEFETLARWSDERLRVLDVALRPIMGDGSVAIGTRGSARDITERWEAQQAAKKSDNRLRTLIDKAPVAMVLARDGKTLYSNPLFVEMFGFENAEEVSSYPLTARLAPETRAEAMRLVTEMVTSGGAGIEIEGIVIRKDGSEFLGHLQLSQVDLSDGPAIMGFIHDLAERRRIEESRLFTRFSVDHAADCVMWLDPEGRVVDVSESTCHQLGYTHDELLGMTVFEISPSASPATWSMHWQDAKDQGSLTLETSQLTKGGELVPFEVTVNHLSFAGREYICSFARDMTERKRAEASLRESEERYRALFERSLDCVYVHDLEGRFLDANAAVLGLLGYDLDEIRSLTFASLLDETQTAHAAEVLRGLLETGSQRDITQSRLRCKSGAYVDVETKASLIFREGKPHAVQGIARDVTERLAMEEQLRQAQKMEALGQLAGGIAHDFNNLLTAIIGYSDLALGAMDPDDPNRLLIEQVRQVGGRASGLTRQILAFSRRQKLESRVVALNEVLGDLEPLLRRTLGEDIDLRFLLAAAPSDVEVDPSQMEQVVLNLVVNARDAMVRGGRLTLETANVELDRRYARTHLEAKPGPYVVLAVSDTGCGMTKETAARVFEPFFTTKDSGKGTGLGLSTVFGIVKQSGGNVSLYSEPGIGTTFRVYLPRSASTAPQATEAVAAGSPTRASGRILVVEDDPSIRDLVARVLRRAGYDVVGASSAEEALSAVGKSNVPPDLLLTDVVLPGGEGGYDLAQSLRARYPSLPVTYMSGYSANSGVQAGRLEAGMDYLEKPFTPDALLQRVRRAVGATELGDC